jgi:hypothetical protein
MAWLDSEHEVDCIAGQRQNEAADSRVTFVECAGAQELPAEHRLDAIRG